MKTEPSLGERARTALAQARVGSLWPRRAAVRARTLTIVGLEDTPGGRPEVLLRQNSPVVRLLAACPIATLSVSGPAPYRSLELTGSFQPMGSSARMNRYRLALLTTRLVGPGSTPVPLAEFNAARPDPLREHAVESLRHLEDAHAVELLHCARAHGIPDAESASPTALDRYGIQLIVMGPHGVDALRLGFPGGPVESLCQVGYGLQSLLACRCGRTDPHHRDSR